MSLLVLTDFDLYKKLVERGEGAVGRVVSIMGKGTTAQGRKWLQFKVAFKKYAETVSDDCKQEYYVVKAWGENAELCGKQLRKGHIVKLAGEFMKSEFKSSDGTHEVGEIKLLHLLDARDPKEGEK